MMESRYDAPCGLYCGACPILDLNECGDEDGLKKLAEQWAMEEKDMHCLGCKSQVNKGTCRIRRCNKGKGLEFCIECDEYPCEIFTEFVSHGYPHLASIQINLETIHQGGVNKWLLSQKTRWSCKGCGARFVWYDRWCKKCGAELYNANEEAKDLQGE